MADRRRPWHVTLRVRLTVLAVVAVTVVLVAGGALLLVGFQRTLAGNAEDAAALRAADLAVLAADDRVPSPIPIQGSDEALVQVVDATGAVVGASANITGEAPLALGRVEPGQTTIVASSQLPISEGEDFRVIVRGADTPRGPVTIYVAVTLEEVTEIVGAAARLGAIGLPVLVVVVAVIIWLLVGRTLAPVDAIRAETDAIGGLDLHRRVPVPDTDDEIGRLARTVNRMLDRLEASAAGQRQFVGDAAHELRSPIASLRTQLETARDSTRPVDWDDVSDDLLDETLRMQQLTEQLLVLARIDTVGTRLDRVALDLDDLVTDILSAVSTRQDDVDIQLDVPPIQVRGDAVLLGQVVRNLIDNAIRHARHTVTVTLAHQGHDAVLTVADDGPGIQPEHRDDVFHRFTRLDDARTRDAGGAGLGLAIVADIVAAHSGTVTIVDRPGSGVTFEVRLPDVQV